MNYFQMQALMPQAMKFAGLMDSRRILKPHVQTVFEAIDKVTPQLRAACAGMDRMKTIMSARSVI